MKTLDRKLRRDLWSMRSQALAIALIIVSGVATFIMSISTLDSLMLTRRLFYREYRFADAFASLKRAPESLVDQIREIRGVEQVESRVVAEVRLRVPGFEEPVVGRLVSIPDEGQPLLNQVYLRKGRLVGPGAEDEAIASEAFAVAHNLEPGDKIEAIINGRLETLTIVGIALSPEYIYEIGPGAIFPDFEHFAVLWMARTPLGTAYDMEGAFNDLVLRLSPRSDLENILDRLDVLLAPYGGLGAYGRKDQLSHRYLSEEFRQLEQLAAIFPTIFLGVAAFLLNIVITRLVNTQREQIAILKAFGYRNIQIGIHYTKLVLIVVLIGIVGGVGAGIWLGKGLSGLYSAFYRFPFLNFELRPAVAIIAALISIGAALLGTLWAVRRAALLPPAEAMRPETPVRYRETLIERIGLKRYLSQPSRMIARHIGRSPVKSLLSIAGIAFACAIMMVGRFQEDAVDFMIDVQFGLSQRQDLTVTFVEPASRESLYEIRGVRGVLHAEPFRSVPARLTFRHRSYRTAIEGVNQGGDLQRLLDADLRVVRLPPAGIVLTDYLGKILGVQAGDELTVEVLEGSRPTRTVPVAGFVSQYIGISGYMDLSALNRLMREGDLISGTYLAVDSRYKEDVYNALHEMPRVAGVVVRENAIRNFYETMGETLLIFTLINTILAGTIAFGVVYNSARIALSERGRELASLRVLGFTRGEISYILLGELGILTLFAIPVGFVIGHGVCAYLATRLQSDLYRVPLVLETDTYAFAATIVLLSGVFSALIVKRKLDRLDLVAVLKTRE